MKKEIIEKISTLITAISGLVVALAWNSAIQEVFSKYYGTGEGVVPMLIYAILVTVGAVILTIWIGRISGKSSEKNDEK
ncbi:MAG: DUF5654 family protein [Candidatus Moraniibacteriota bacterium]